MVKSEITNDPNEARDKALNSPLCRLIDQTWRLFDEEISQPVRLKEEDIVRYVVWSIENIKGGEEEPSASCLDLRRSIVNLFRDIYNTSVELDSLSNVICAYVIACLDCACLYSYRQDIKRLCFVAENSLHNTFKQNVLVCKNKIKNGILHSGVTSALGEWCTNHLLNEEFYTEEDAGWYVENTPVHKPKNRTTKSSNTDKPIVRYTIKYNNNNADRVSRISLVKKKLEEWGWIEKGNEIDNFNAFFTGCDTDCKIVWKGQPAVLYDLISSLLQQTTFIEKTTGGSAASIVRNQFKIGLDQHKERVTAEESQYINLIIFCLTPQTQLPVSKNGGLVRIVSDTPTLVKAMNEYCHK